MPELERMLTQLGGELDYPPTPELAPRVAARVAAGARSDPRRAQGRGLGPRRSDPFHWRRTLALALAGLLLLAAAAVAAVPGARDAVLEFLGLQGATVERREQLPRIPGARTIDLGRQVRLADAGGSLAFEPLVPADPGRPDAAYVRRVPGGELSLVYRRRPGLPPTPATGIGLLVSEFRGDLLPEYVGKIGSETTRIERLTIDGERAIWIEGAPHFFFYRAPDDAVVDRPLRLARNVLLLERGDVLVRLEADFDRERAIEIARSLR